jgi:hypothetical protein
MRKNRVLARTVSGTLTVAVAASAALLIGGVATAAPPAGTLGSLTITPPAASDITDPTIHTSGPCPNTAAAANVTLTGPVGATDPTFPPDNPFVIVVTTDAAFSTTAPFSLPFRLTPKDAATDRGKTLQVGEYDVTVRCVDGIAGTTVFGTFTGAMFFTSPTAWQTTDPNGGTPGPTPVVTPTPVITPTPVVTPTPAVTPTPLVTPPVVTATPVVTPTPMVTPTPVVTPTPGPGAQVTTTMLITTPRGSFPSDFPVSLSAIVRPRTATGTVQFKDGDTNIGNPVTVSRDLAFTITSTLTTGTHSLTAVFTPTDATKFSGSTSPPMPLTVTPPIINRVQLLIQFILRLLSELHF